MNENNYDHIRNYIDNNVNDNETQILISDFAILWNEYEDELHNREHHIKNIYKVINRLKIEIYEFEINLLYDRLKKYIESKMVFDYSNIVHSYNILIKQPKKQNDGSIIYIGEIYERELKRIIYSNELKDKMFFLLLITARVRNNMFHGQKEIQMLKYQKELFRVCNETLKLTLDMEKKY